VSTALSTCEAEIHAAPLAVLEIVFIRGLLIDLGYEPKNAPPLRVETPLPSMSPRTRCGTMPSSTSSPASSRSASSSLNRGTTSLTSHKATRSQELRTAAQHYDVQLCLILIASCHRRIVWYLWCQTTHENCV
jgi:hypothetical protein